MNRAIKLSGNILGVSLIASALLVDPNEPMIFAASAGSAVAGSVSETDRRNAEKLMLQAQAAAYARGEACNCPYDAFLEAAKESGAEPYHANELLVAQANAYARGEIHWSVSPQYGLSETATAANSDRLFE